MTKNNFESNNSGARRFDDVQPFAAHSGDSDTFHESSPFIRERVYVGPEAWAKLGDPEEDDGVMTIRRTMDFQPGDLAVVQFPTGFMMTAIVEVNGRLRLEPLDDSVSQTPRLIPKHIEQIMPGVLKIIGKVVRTERLKSKPPAIFPKHFCIGTLIE